MVFIGSKERVPDRDGRARPARVVSIPAIALAAALAAGPSLPAQEAPLPARPPVEGFVEISAGRVQYLDWGYAWSSDGRSLAVIRTAAVECVDDPTTDWCEQAQLSIVDVAKGRSTLIYRGPLTSTAGGLDWRP